MKSICDLCTHQESDGQGGVRCGATSYSYNEGYGPFKQGAVCAHDADLKDHFKPRTGAEIDIHNLSAQANFLSKEKSALADRVRALEARLTKLDL